MFSRGLVSVTGSGKTSPAVASSTSAAPTSSDVREMLKSETDVRLPRMINTGGDRKSLLGDDHIRKILKHIPPRYGANDWKLVYSTDQHGYSLKTLYRKVRHCGPIVLVAMDTSSHVFGAYASEDVHESCRYYGTGESFVMQVHPRFQVFRSTHANNLFFLPHSDFLAFGGGGSFALYLDSMLERGTSGRSDSFNNDVLASTSSFKCIAVEVWAIAS